MGLDMYLEGHIHRLSEEPQANASTAESKEGQEEGSDEDDWETDDEQAEIELGYWRKHPDLHGFIVNTFAGGVDDNRDIPLSALQIHQIIDAIENDALPSTSGFFFGCSKKPDDAHYEEQKARDLEVFAKALDWLFAGQPSDGGKRCVSYMASW